MVYWGTEAVVTSQYDSSWFTKQNGVFTLDRTIHLRDKPRDGNIIATLNKGDCVTYDAYGYEKTVMCGYANRVQTDMDTLQQVKLQTTNVLVVGVHLIKGPAL